MTRKEQKQEEIRLSQEEWQALKEKAEKAEDYLDQLLRLQAEFENIRKRLQKEKEDHTKYAHGEIVRGLLPIYDHFVLALSSMNGSSDSDLILKGVTLIKNEMWDFLTGHGLSKIETVGCPFNPEQHEAVGVVEDDSKQENTVVEEVRPGYLLNGKLLRPATVKVSRKKQTQEKMSETKDQGPKTEDLSEGLMS